VSTFYIQQFGCRATQADGAALERQLLDHGYVAAPDSATASIVVLNTCTVTAAADAQARDSIRKIHAQNPNARMIVTGCYAQRAPEELSTLPGVHWVVGNSHKPQIPNLVAKIAPAATFYAGKKGTAIPTENESIIPVEDQRVIPSGARNLLFLPAPDSQLAQILTGDIFAHPEFLSAPIQGGESHHTRPILKIQDGCNNRCSFCIIPYVRGKSRSLPPDRVIREIQHLTSTNQPSPSVGQTLLSVSPQVAQACPDPRRALLPVHSSLAHPLLPVHPSVAQPILAVPPSLTQPSQPAKEIVLSGINLGTYGRDLTPRVNLLDLARRILDETTVERLRLSSIEPQDITQDLIQLFAENDRLAQHFHMPLQSASNNILVAMHRWYRAEHYARRLDLIHSLVPNAAIGADVIAGHPGETDADHAATLSFIQQHPFTYLHVFSYSPRPGTKAASHPDQVPPAVIKQRARELRAQSEAKSAAFRHSQLDRTLKVLTLQRNDTDEPEGTTPALSTNYLRAQVPTILPSNLWIEMRITDSAGNYLRGEIIEPTHQTLCESSAHSASLR
jgi:threonylcarbamoyladenosine tRNA methylthiotransferase MtaB